VKSNYPSEGIPEALNAIVNAEHITAFTGAGISAESGIPTFRGKDGLWDRYDPEVLSLEYFYRHPQEAWEGIREIFYSNFLGAQPNPAHFFLARMERAGLVEGIITQNIDGLHQKAGSTNVIEYHGSSSYLACTGCGRIVEFDTSHLENLPPRCSLCNDILKPNFIFFGEMIPEDVQARAAREMSKSDLIIVIGTTGEVMPACLLPWEAKKHQALILEININPSAYTGSLSDIFLRGSASDITTHLGDQIFKGKS
jgi:NAD-dependent deacetylase